MTVEWMARDELQNEVERLRARVVELERAAERGTGTIPSLCEGLSLRDLLDHTDGFLALLSPDGILVEVNRAPLEAAGLRREQVVGRLFWDTGWWTRSPTVRD